jgi:hypothetical protein
MFGRAFLVFAGAMIGFVFIHACVGSTAEKAAQPPAIESAPAPASPQVELDLMSKCHIACDGYMAKFVVEDKNGTKVVQCDCFNTEREIEK